MSFFQMWWLTDGLFKTQIGYLALISFKSSEVSVLVYNLVEPY